MYIRHRDSAPVAVSECKLAMIGNLIMANCLLGRESPVGEAGKFRLFVSLSVLSSTFRTVSQGVKWQPGRGREQEIRLIYTRPMMFLLI